MLLVEKLIQNVLEQTFIIEVSLFFHKQATEWNEETTEDQAESPVDAVDDASAQNSERKEENAVTGIEENEWDRLLRVRLGALLVLAPIIISLHFMCTVTVG